MCHNSITGGHMNFTLRSQHEDDPPTCKAHNGCHSNDGCLATGATKSAVYDLIYQKLKCLQISQEACTFNKNSGSRDPIFGKVGHRSRSQEHIMYIAKICLNSVPAGPINFILGG